MLEPVVLVGHEPLVAGDHLLGRDQAARLRLDLLFLGLEALDRHARILQHLWPRVDEDRHGRGVGLEVGPGVPDRSGGPADDVVDADPAHRGRVDHHARLAIGGRGWREEADEALECVRVEELIGGDPFDAPLDRLIERLKSDSSAGDPAIGRDEELVDVEEHSRKLGLPLDVGLEVERDDGRPFALRDDEPPKEIGGPKGPEPTRVE